MPTFVFTDPTGKKHKVTGPDGSTADEAFRVLQDQLGPLPTAPKTTGEKVGEAISNVASKVPDVLQGTLELPAAIVTQGIGNLAGHAAGAGQYLHNALTPDYPGKNQPIDVFNKVSDTLTYKPTSTSGQASLNTFNNVLGSTVGKVGSFVGDVAKGMGADPYIEQATRDAATTAATLGLAKGAPATLGKAVGGGKWMANKVKENPVAAAALAGEALGIPGAATLGAGAAIAKAISNRVSSSPSREVMVIPSNPFDKFTTKEQGASTAADFAAYKAETMAANRARIEQQLLENRPSGITTSEGIEVMPPAMPEGPTSSFTQALRASKLNAEDIGPTSLSPKTQQSFNDVRGDFSKGRYSNAPEDFTAQDAVIADIIARKKAQGQGSLNRTDTSKGKKK